MTPIPLFLSSMSSMSFSKISKISLSRAEKIISTSNSICAISLLVLIIPDSYSLLMNESIKLTCSKPGKKNNPTGSKM